MVEIWEFDCGVCFWFGMYFIVEVVVFVYDVIVCVLYGVNVFFNFFDGFVVEIIFIFMFIFIFLFKYGVDVFECREMFIF